VRVIVTGGAGYIGAHVVRALAARGDEPVVVDDLSSGRRDRVRDVPFVHLDLVAPHADRALADELSGADAVVHLAARKQVGESVERPAWYRAQNVGGVETVIAAVREAGIPRLVFSSTAAVYASDPVPVGEGAATVPSNPYGETKLTGERLIADAAGETGLRAASLRFFNVAGAATPELVDDVAQNLIPIVLRRLDAGEAPRIYGDDYATPDGTCLRDYVHVEDVADAHLAVLDALEPGHRVYNVGTGRGASVREVIDGLVRLTGSAIEPEVVARRPGDPPSVVADVARIARELGWTARHDLAGILRSAVDAHRAAPGSAKPRW
jgi:UDP-glucose 4-epimerase